MSKDAFDIRVPIKHKYLRSNQSPFMNKKISRAIMNRTKLRNRFLGTRSNEDKAAYNKQWNYCVSLIRKTKQQYYNNLHHRKVADNRSFWKYIKPLFSDKSSNSNKITLVEKDLILEKNNDIPEVFDDFFRIVASNLNIPRYQDPFIDSEQTENQTGHLILRMIEQYKNYPSIIAINNQNMDRRLSFKEITKSEINLEILNLDSSKACQESDLPTKVIKANSDIFKEVIHKDFNRGLEIVDFPCTMKLANVKPVYKKGNRSEKGNYRPVSILPNISKVFERCVHKQMSQVFEGVISKYLCGFLKGHSAQHALISLLEKWRYNVDQGRMFGALLTDFSKAFDCLPHDIIIAKLNAYKFDMKVLNFIYDYSRNRKQRTKIDNAYSSWQNILYGVPQESIFAPLLFDIDLCNFISHNES